VPFVVLQPPFEEFKPLVERPEAKRTQPVQVMFHWPLLHAAEAACTAELQPSIPHAQVYVNGVSIRGDGLHVIATEKDTPQDPWPFSNDYSGTLVLTEPGTGLWEMVVRSATSFSTSVGPALPVIVGDLLVELLPEVDAAAAPIAFCCENDHAAVDELAAKLKGRVEVVHCMVRHLGTLRDVVQRISTSSLTPACRRHTHITTRRAHTLSASCQHEDGQEALAC
jgi:hypothetical protein